MAGFRTFATGEVLTAANVNNFLMGQSVMRFADADARTAALGADVVEGMLTYNLDTDQLEVFDGAAFVVAAPEPPAGIGSNVVQAVLTDVFVTSSTSYTDVTGLTVTITPSSNTSRILVIADISLNGDFGPVAAFRINGGDSSNYVADEFGSLVRAKGGERQATNYNPFLSSTSKVAVFLDSPNTTSSVTYAAQIQTASGQAYVNRSRSDTEFRVASSITAIEVAA